MGFHRTFTVILVAVAALTAPVSANALELQEVGTFQAPTFVTSDPGDADRLFVVERDGQIELREGGDTTRFLNIDSIVHSSGEPEAGGEQGLFSMAFSPDYATNGLFYVVYSGIDDPTTASEDETGDYHIDEFSSDGDTADAPSRREVLTIERVSRNHYGGQLHFGPDGYLYASTGDDWPEGDPEGNAQNVESLLGKILRIDPTGSGPGEYTVPADNPFTGAAGCADGCDEIWSYGLRNPWRFSFDRGTGALVIADVGQATYEEVDYEPASVGLGRGDNFGWNCREAAHDYPGPGEPAPACADRGGTFTEPVFEYQTHVNGTCSITGGYVVRDRALDDLYGRYVYADFCVGDLRSLSLGRPTASGDRSEGLTVPRVTSFGEDADCRLYVASVTGPVYRLTESAGGPTGCEPPDTSIDSGPAAGSTTNDDTPTFGFSSTEPNSSFECRVDGGGFSACSSAHTTVPLPDGGHTFEVRAKNRAGKPDPSPASRSFTVDTSLPPAAEPVTLTLDLDAKRQELRRKLKFFATASADSTLVANGKAIKKATKELAAEQTTKIKAKLKGARRKRLAGRLDKKGKAKVKVKATATDRSGAAVDDKVKVKLRD